MTVTLVPYGNAQVSSESTTSGIHWVRTSSINHGRWCVALKRHVIFLTEKSAREGKSIQEKETIYCHKIKEHARSSVFFPFNFTGEELHMMSCDVCQNRNKLFFVLTFMNQLYLPPQETHDGQRYIFKCQHGEPECLGNMIEVKLQTTYIKRDAAE